MWLPRGYQQRHDSKRSQAEQAVIDDNKPDSAVPPMTKLKTIGRERAAQLEAAKSAEKNVQSIPPNARNTFTNLSYADQMQRAVHMEMRNLLVASLALRYGLMRPDEFPNKTFRAFLEDMVTNPRCAENVDVGERPSGVQRSASSVSFDSRRASGGRGGLLLSPVRAVGGLLMAPLRLLGGRSGRDVGIQAIDLHGAALPAPLWKLRPGELRAAYGQADRNAGGDRQKERARALRAQLKRHVEMYLANLDNLSTLTCTHLHLSAQSMGFTPPSMRQIRWARDVRLRLLHTAASIVQEPMGDKDTRESMSRTLSRARETLHTTCMEVCPPGPFARSYAETFAHNVGVIVKIQGWYRMHKLRKWYRSIIRAVIVLQKMWRGFLARKKYAALKKMKMAAKTIGRMHVSGKRRMLGLKR